MLPGRLRFHPPHVRHSSNLSDMCTTHVHRNLCLPCRGVLKLANRIWANEVVFNYLKTGKYEYQVRPTASGLLRSAPATRLQGLTVHTVHADAHTPHRGMFRYTCPYNPTACPEYLP